MRWYYLVFLSLFSPFAIADEVFYCKYIASGTVNNGELHEYQQFTGIRFKMKMNDPLGIVSTIQFSVSALLSGDYKIRDCWGACTTRFMASNDYHYHDTILQFIEGKTLQIASINGYSTVAKEAKCERF